MSTTSAHLARCSRTILCLVAVSCIAVPAAAQLDRGQITGTIKDQSGAVVPGATVTATDLQTQAARTTVTDGSGFYTFPNLSPSRYTIAAELQGFRKVVTENVQLDALAVVNLDFMLQAGALTESITVSATTPLQTDVAVRKTVEAKDIELLAFSGRNPIGVVGLKAGVNGGNFNSRGFDDLGNGGFNINGSRPEENNITIDGAVAIRTRSSGNIIGIQSVDAIQEVQVLTANYMPEYRPRQRRADPVHHQERQQSFHRQRRVLPARRVAAGQHLVPQPQHEPARQQRARRRSTTSSTATRRRTRSRARCSRTSCSSSARRNGSTSFRCHQHRDRPDRGDAARRLQRAAESGQWLLHRPSHHQRPGERPAVPGQHHSARAPVAERPRVSEYVIRCPPPASGKARPT